eukprot:6251185-Lingulodinium_polyedra.AAC.1
MRGQRQDRARAPRFLPISCAGDSRSVGFNSLGDIPHIPPRVFWPPRPGRRTQQRGPPRARQ